MQAVDFFKQCNSVINNVNMPEITAFGAQEEMPGESEFLDDFLETEGVTESGSYFMDDFIDDFVNVISATDDVQQNDLSESFESFMFNTSYGLQSIVFEECPTCVNGDRIEDVLRRMLQDDLYIVKNGKSLKEVYNMNFPNSVETEGEALRKLLIVYYEFAVSAEVADAWASLLTKPLVEGLSSFGREAALSDIQIFQRLLNSQEDFDFFKLYAYTEEITRQLWQVKEQGCLDKEGVARYSENAELLKVYLASILDGTYDKEIMNSMLAVPGGSIAFSKVDRRVLCYVPLVQQRADKDTLLQSLSGMCDRKADVAYTDLVPYRNSPHLKEIIESIGTHGYSKPFIDKYLKEGPCEEYALQYYASGKLQPVIFQKMNCDVNVTMLVSDMEVYDIQEQKLLDVCFTEGSDNAKRGAAVIAKSFYSGEITSTSYKQILFLLGMEGLCHRALDCLAEVGAAVSFNYLMYCIIAKELGCVLKMERIDAKTVGGALLLARDNSSIKACSVENLVFGFDEITGMFQENSTIRVLNQNAGICILNRAVNFDDKLLSYSIMSSGSLDAWGGLPTEHGLNTFGRDIKYFCNTILFLNCKTDCADTLLEWEALFNERNITRILRERLFFRLNHDLSWAGCFFASSHAAEWFPFWVEVCNCKRSGLVMYKVLSRVLASFCGSKFVSARPDIKQLPAAEGMIELKGFPYSFTELSYSAFLLSMDGMFPKIMDACSVKLSQIGNKIQIIMK